MSGGLPSAELLAFLRSRRSVRRFSERPVPAKLIEQLIESATRAPNAHNRQVWRFVQLASEESRINLADAMGAEFRAALLAEGLDEEQADEQVARSRARIQEAPEAILLCLDISLLDEYENEERSRGEYLMGVQSVALAGGQLLLAAHAEGLGGVWMCAPLFTPEAVADALDLPPSWQAQGLLLLGYPIAERPQRERLPLAEVMVSK